MEPAMAALIDGVVGGFLMGFMVGCAYTLRRVYVIHGIKGMKKEVTHDQRSGR